MDIKTLTIAEARRALDAGEYSAEDLAKAYLEGISEKNDDIHAFLEVFDDVLEQARMADAAIQAGASKPMTGIPIAIKDNILIEGRKVSAASAILENYVASYDASVIQKLKAEGAVFLGRTNMDEFAMGSSTENSAFGVTKNPRDTKRVPGGSSGGSAAAVAAEFALAALGSDTGGSVRQPASLTGTVGLKPTYGAVSRYGLIAMGSSLDQIGPLTRTVADARMIFESIRGHDPKDSTTLPESFYTTRANKPKTIGVPRALLAEGVDSDVVAQFEDTLQKLSKNGFEIVDIDLPSFQYALAAYYIIMPAEASTNLTRFDGVRYGLSVAADALQDVYKKTRREGFGPEVRRRILTGTFVLSAGYVDAYYRRAKSLRDHIRNDLEKAFAIADVMATPTAPTPAFAFGEKSDPLTMYAADMFTVPMNLSGSPALSIPDGSVARDGSDLPTGFQITGPHGGEEALFAVGEVVEKVSR